MGQAEGTNLSTVMAGLLPAIHVFTLLITRKTRMRGKRPGMTARPHVQTPFPTPSG